MRRAFVAAFSQLHRRISLFVCLQLAQLDAMATPQPGALAAGPCSRHSSQRRDLA
jgi:hypothetical protein